MLPTYANKATKETLLCLSGSKGFCEALLREGSNYRNKESADKYLRIASENLQLAINEMCRGLDANQLKGIVRFGDGISLAVTPKSSPYLEKEDYIVSRDSSQKECGGMTRLWYLQKNCSKFWRNIQSCVEDSDSNIGESCVTKMRCHIDRQPLLVPCHISGVLSKCSSITTH
jgi:hypothetical protein